MMDNLFYLLIGLSASSFGIGFAYCFKFEKEMNNKHASSNRLERLEALQFAYYIIGIIFLVLSFATITTLFN